MLTLAHYNTSPKAPQVHTVPGQKQSAVPSTTEGRAWQQAHSPDPHQAPASHLGLVFLIHQGKGENS